MNIICPHCSNENKIEYSENIICSQCKQPFTGYTYKKFKKPLISATTALFIGFYGGYKADDIIRQNRYPIRAEYEIIDNCINSSQVLMSSKQRVEKTKTCVCALEKTMNEVGLDEINESASVFLTRFRANVPGCL